MTRKSLRPQSRPQSQPQPSPQPSPQSRPQAAKPTFVCQSMTEISYQAEFDAVVASYSMLCLDPASFGVVAAKIAKALRPGGRCFVALNEAADGEDADAAAMVNIAGQDMYSRAYTEEEVIRLFADMNLLSVGRALVRTEMFGDERSIVFVFGKAGDSVTA